MDTGQWTPCWSLRLNTPHRTFPLNPCLAGFVNKTTFAFHIIPRHFLKKVTGCWNPLPGKTSVSHIGNGQCRSSGRPGDLTEVRASAAMVLTCMECSGLSARRVKYIRHKRRVKCWSSKKIGFDWPNMYSTSNDVCVCVKPTPSLFQIMGCIFGAKLWPKLNAGFLAIGLFGAIWTRTRVCNNFYLRKWIPNIPVCIMVAIVYRTQCVKFSALCAKVTQHRTDALFVICGNLAFLILMYAFRSITLS